ncbi:hypothetical protein Csa_000785 [Cucumis sativus]|uniref:Uncharacterized protein n=1 Tax=Cucumis sativus TaxID=3659 RepID=A0A0A0LFG9_CUCSA|nr:hypothetical protein Csa_000785 [Cucumis sativus]
MLSVKNETTSKNRTSTKQHPRITKTTSTSSETDSDNHQRTYADVVTRGSSSDTKSLNSDSEETKGKMKIEEGKK